jgi:AraC-like DNA-binding protein
MAAVSQLHEIDMPPRAALGRGVLLRPLALDEDIDVWLVEYRATRGSRRCAVLDRCQIGVQLAGTHHERTHRSGPRVIEQGKLHLIGAGEVYDSAYAAGDEPARIVWFAANADRVGRNMDDDREVGLVDAAGERSGDLGELAELLLRDGRATPQLASDVRSAVARFVAKHGRLSPRSQAIAARREAERHYTSELYLAHVAETVGLHPVALLRQFKQRYGTTPVQFRVKTPLNAADRLLWSRPELPIAEVAARSGFDSVSYFYRQYVAYLGATPARRRQLFNAGGPSVQEIGPDPTYRRATGSASPTSEAQAR